MEVAYPPRFWWLKRVGTGAILLLAGLALFHWWLTRHVDARLERIVDGWRADPEAPLPEMLLVMRGPPTGEDNAAFHYHRAMTAMPELTQKQQWEFQDGPQFPVPANKVELLREILAAAQPQLDGARHARSLQRVDWNLPALSVTTGSNWPAVVALARRQNWAMSLAHHDGDIAAAVEYGRDTHVLGAAEVSYGPSLTAGLVASWIQALAANRFIDAAWHRPQGMSEQQEREAWRAAAPQVRGAVAELMDERIDREILTLTWKGERLMTYSALSTPGYWPRGPSTRSNWLFGPVVKADVARLFEQENALVAAGESGDPARMLAASPEPRSLAGQSASFYQIMHSSMGRANISLLRGIVHRRAAAVVLASKLYHADHGRWPDSLESLVPDHLPRVPTDPFSRTGAAMGFRTDIYAPVPIVYSVADDMIDNGGSTGGASSSWQWLFAGSINAFELQDIVFPLYLPPDLEDPGEFNVWYWLHDPQAEKERLQKLKREREKDAEIQPPATDFPPPQE